MKLIYSSDEDKTHRLAENWVALEIYFSRESIEFHCGSAAAAAENI